MAIYHFSAKMISRANGSCALAAAAYRSASRLHDQRLDRAHDFSSKAGVVHSEVMLPRNAPEEWADREKLWNAVEAAEARKDAQLAREVEFAIPRELDQEQGIRLARAFVKAEFVDKGMIADLNVHWDIGEDGLAKPHAHVMLTTRSVDEDGFGPKVRDWNATSLLEHWRERWAGQVNARLAELDIDARVDHRTLQAQGIDLDPQHKIGPAAARMAGQGLSSERLVEHVEIARSNGEKILSRPEIALDAITRMQATFTTRDLAKFVHRHSDGKEQFDQVMAAVRASPDLVALGRDGRGAERFTSREMLETERRLERESDALVARRAHHVQAAVLDRAIATAGSHGLRLVSEQQDALRHVVRDDGLSSVVGYAGTGKSAMLGVARDAWEQAGYRVTGLALSGIAAENLESGSGIASRTIASIEHQWGQGRELLGATDIVVVDEAGMIGTRQLERIVREVENRQAKLVLVGDPEQLQAIDAGAAFRAVAERHGAIEITQVRRQQIDWQRDATRQLATGRTDEVITAYADAGHVHAAPTREAARAALIDRWDEARKGAPAESRMILTHTRAEVAELNALARDRLRAGHELGIEYRHETSRGERLFASGDRVMFLANERGLGVKNGSVGTIESVSSTRMAVLMDDGRSVAFDVKDYADLDHGYAATIHKTQGVTVDRAHVLATPGLDRHAAYVALSRHRTSVDIHYGQDDFADRGKLIRALSRERGKDMAIDYAAAEMMPPSHQRAEIRSDAPSPDRQVVPARNPFAGLKLRPIEPAAPERSPLEVAVERLGRAAADIVRLADQGLPTLPHQQAALRQAARQVDTLQPGGGADLIKAFNADRGLIDETAKGRTAAAIRAMQLEAEIRQDLQVRADRFITEWQRQTNQYHLLRKAGEIDAADRLGARIAGLARSLERDPQLESLLRNRRIELGLKPSSSSGLSHDLQEHLGLSRSRGISL
jgi:Ti-type conjugative transfer relaxase TraA